MSKLSIRGRYFRRYLSTKVLPVWSILLIDTLLVAISVFGAFLLRFDWQSIWLYSAMVEKSILAVVVVNLVFFHVFRTYSNVLRFSSFVDVMRIFVALTVSYALLAVFAVVLAHRLHPAFLPFSVLVISYVSSFALMACSRIVVKVLFDTLNLDRSNSHNVFIYGAREAGVNIAKAIRVSLNNRYRLRGFIADEPELINKEILGVRVYPNDEMLAENLRRHRIEVVIVSPAKMDELKNTDMVDRLLALNIRLMTAPPLSEWNSPVLKRDQLKDIQIEDLLPRDPIQIDIRKVASHLEGKRVMITGAAGSIGSEIMRQVASFNPYKLILVDQAETPLHDIRLELQDHWRDIDAVTLGPEQLDGAAGNVDEDDGQQTVDELVRELDAVGVAEELVHVREVMQPLLVDRGDLSGPRFGEDELVVREGRALLAGHGHVEGGVAAEREGKVNVSGVGDLERLGEAAVGDGIGHVEAVVERVGGARLVAGAELVGHARRGLGNDGVLVEARDTVALEGDVALSGGGVVAAKAADDGEEHRGAPRPVALVALPEVLATLAHEAHELGALCVDRGGEVAVGNARQRGHACPFHRPYLSKL